MRKKIKKIELYYHDIWTGWTLKPWVEVLACALLFLLLVGGLTVISLYSSYHH